MPVRDRTRKINLSDEEPVRVSRRRSARVTLFGGVAKASDREDSPVYAALKTYESTQIADPFSQSYQVSSPLGVNSIIAPPFNPYALLRLPNENNTLRQCIDAMVINIEAMGHRFEYVGPEGGEESKEAQAELTRLEALTAQPNGEYGLLEFRERVRRDLETFGYRYIEICRGAFNRQIVSIYHVPAHSMRLTGMDNEETEVSIWLPRDGKMVMQKIKRRFRRYVQEVGSHRTYFKEYGDPRPISSSTGMVIPGASSDELATEIHFGTLYTPGNLYGLPRWINQLPAVLGSRESEMTNLSFFRDNAIPAMAIMVSGGHLTADSIDEIEEHINAVRGRQSSHRVMVLEAEGSEKAAGPDKSISAPKVEMKSMLHDRQNDALFQEYDKNNQTKVRSSFRIPPIFIGRSEELTYATAEASLTMAEAQVFGPERNKVDDLFNQVVLSDAEGRMPIYWKFRSNPPRVSNPKDVLEALKTLDALGALTPNVAIGIANEMFDLNIETVKEDWGDFPFELVKMLAQKGQLKGLDALVDTANDALGDQTDPQDQQQVDPATGEEIKGLVKQALNGLKGKNNNVRKVSKTRK